jgi:FMN phosphatase YigB (HAD superfamily)
MNEQQYILMKFNELYTKFRNKRIAIYGVGINTKYILENASDLKSLSGLIDRSHAGENMYGYHVFSEEEVLNVCDIIIIIARVVVIHVIFKRIMWMVDRGIKVYNINGEDLSILFRNYNENFYITNTYWDKSLQDLQDIIDRHDIISFDLFDTLLMRKVVFPTDIFNIVEREYYDTFKKTIPFVRKRIEVELILSEKSPVTLDEIYFALDFNIDDKIWLKKCELNVDKSLLVPRKEIVDCYNYSIKNKKIVIITSDMYYSSEILKSILLQNNIIGYNEIIVSCEHGVTKESGELFKKITNKYKGSILHIGDNINADIEMPKKYGIDSYYLMSAYEMILNSSLSDLLVNIHTIDDSLMIGDFASVLLNSPFALCKEKGKLFIDSFDKISSFFTPIIKCFLQYLIKIMLENINNTLIFLSRDGYLIYKLYTLLIDQFSLNIPKGHYVLSSRSALCNDDYKDNYILYFRQFVDSEQTFIFDWVTKGTSITKLQKLLFNKINKSVSLICFASFNIRSSGFTGQSHSMLGDHNFYNLPLHFLNYYELIEIILPPPNVTQLLYFNRDLKPIFADECSEYGKQWDNIQQIQNIIIFYFTEQRKIDNNWYNRSPSSEIADKILGLISSKTAVVDNKIKSTFVFESQSENIKPTEWWDKLVH